MNCKSILYSILAAATGIVVLAGCNGAKTDTAAKNDRMDLTVKPGDDFYQYASGNWIKTCPRNPNIRVTASLTYLAKSTTPASAK